jgi:3-phytase
MKPLALLNHTSFVLAATAWQSAAKAWRRCTVAALGCALACTPAWAAAPAAGAPPAPLPRAALKSAQELAALPGGNWLALEKRTLRLLGPQGQERAQLALRAEHLDTRSGPQGTLAVLVDATTQQTLRVQVDEAAGSLQLQPAVPSPPFSVQALCLHRDAQGLDHVFILGDEGLVEQWLLRADAPALLVRRSAVVQQARSCRVDDRAALLYVNAEDGGLWAYRADAEGPPHSHAVALPRPLGPLDGGAAAFVVLPGGLAVLEASGRRLHLLQREGAARWRTTARLPVRVQGDVEAMALRVRAATVELFWRDESSTPWQQQSAAWKRSADAGLPPALPIVLPAAATVPVSQFGDAADDPAIWVHPQRPELSRVLGTNKRAGLHVYDLQGRELQFLASGRVNNVDVRQGVLLGEKASGLTGGQPGAQTLDLAVGTQRDDMSLVVYRIGAEGEVQEAGRIPTGLPDIYGTCLHKPRAGGLEVFVNDKDGRFERWRLQLQDGRISGTRIQGFAVKSQPEGCVADDTAERLFIGEEDEAVWALSLAPADGLGSQPKMTRVIGIGGLVKDDIEGLALYEGGAEGGNFLVVSSQGNNSYVVLEAAPPYRVRGAFRVGIHTALGIDAVSETDGLDVTARPLGPRFPRGIFVAQDGFKRLPDGPQNYKIVDWRDIARALNLP